MRVDDTPREQLYAAVAREILPRLEAPPRPRYRVLAWNIERGLFQLLADRGFEYRNPVVIHGLREGRAAPMSAHDAIGVEVVV